MGQVLKREHGGRRAAFAALLTTGMLAALLALTGIAAPAPAYAADQLKGTGTADDPVLIYTTDDLIAWCDRLNAMGEVQERQQHARLMDHLVAPGPDGTVHGGAVTDDVIDEMNHPDLPAAELDGNGKSAKRGRTKARGRPAGDPRRPKKAASSAPANKDARAGTTKAADDGTPATLPPHERDTAGGLAAALATAERERTTGTRRAACLNAAPPTREPTVETMDARPKRETRPTGTRTPIAGREARMHERKTLAGQGGHAPPGTSTALKRRLYLGRPEKGASAEWETRLGRWKQR